MDLHVSNPCSGLFYNSVNDFDRTAWRRRYKICTRTGSFFCKLLIAKVGSPSLTLLELFCGIRVRSRRLNCLRSSEKNGWRLTPIASGETPSTNLVVTGGRNRRALDSTAAPRLCGDIPFSAPSTRTAGAPISEFGQIRSTLRRDRGVPE